jgi:trans-2,3-dihydro-3-hydroxyanthranilate isomerase
MRYRFVIADVFSRRPFGGNQLAVFPEASGLGDQVMQALAREFNFAETTFVFPPIDPSAVARVRIFTPRRELDFAGHPTLGTAAVLAALGVIPTPDGWGQAVLEERIGPVPVEMMTQGGAIHVTLQLAGPVVTATPPPARSAVARALSLPDAAVVDCWYASVGIPFCFVHLADPGLVDRATLDRTVWKESLADGWSAQLFFFSGALAPGSRLYARMFAPAFGIEEDPASGSAAAALAGVAAERLPQGDGSFAWTVDQGVSLGRPSELEIGATKREGRVTGVRVGGFSVLVGDGTIDVPA